MSRHDQPHILVVDDDDRLRDLLTRYLGENGFVVSAARNAAEARSSLAGMQFDLLVLDVLMPGEKGVDLARSLRGEGTKVPILLLTALSETEDRISGLEAGADDYLAKPFEPRELVLRIEAILRRYAQVPAPLDENARDDKSTMAQFGNFTFDLSRMTLQRGSEHIYLTSAEQALLAALVRRRGETTKREDLHRMMGGNAVDPGASRSIDVQVTRLRRKFEEDPKQPRYLQTVRGRGYVLYVD
ncbi:two-component system, OmpR family, phosphate regulon response regulator OmpR [Thalassospira xiamenensis M-5 = DSM 17429]|uniref:Winged helix family two component transcriptional regulator n=2 Tax=Thalassospira TaxID=168934 RepID=A0AB72UGM3_9PROT|nr:response regulator [Thalassospira xiamenensis]AJD53426.1 winged helix family two component transcriptional regulator [Thalassospira xiamenensis M-5 = DSM 17429]SIT06125.1 two-component system, OmpR family, phosphate regulon response regulator OmpR [Thalassospira xiamenensis M-5 = DSM 17429]